MESNPLQRALESRLASQGPQSVINLIDSDFHANGFMLPRSLLQSGFEAYLAQRAYRPHPKGSLAAREAICRFYRQGGPVSQTPDCLVQADPESILLTASSSESYNLLFQAFTQPGDNILLPAPSYPLFEDLCRYNHLEPRFYPLHEDSGHQPDIAVLDSLCDERSRFLVVISPNNPTGCVLGEDSLTALASLCAERRLMLISDEVFSEFLYTTDVLPRPASWASLAAPPPVPVFTINGISKLFASPDLKLSWILHTGPDRHPHSQVPLLQDLELRNDTFLNANSLSQFLLPSLFEQAPAFVRGMVEACAANRLYLAEHLLADLPPACRLQLPDGGIHCLLRFSRYQVPDDEKLAIQLLEQAGVYLHPGYLYGMEPEPALVLSVLKDPASFRQGIARLAQALPGLL